jgi:hypothetical protein
MKQNMGSVDRILRIVLAAVFAWLYFSGTVTGVLGLVLLVLGVVFVLTSSCFPHWGHPAIGLISKASKIRVCI